MTTTSAIVRWEPPTKLPAYNTLTYNLAYAAVVDDNGNLGEEVQVSVEDLHFELTGLQMASKYAFKIQVFALKFVGYIRNTPGTRVLILLNIFILFKIGWQTQN